jgi:hypothetical protein
MDDMAHCTGALWPNNLTVVGLQAQYVTCHGGISEVKHKDIPFIAYLDVLGDVMGVK